MKVTSIDLFDSDNSDVLEPFCTLGFRDPTGENPYQMKGIVGLDAVEITPKFYGRGDTSGRSYYNLSMPPRDIILRIGLNPDFVGGGSYSELRDTLYRNIFTSRGGYVSIHFKNGPGYFDLVGVIAGFVTKFEAPLIESPEIQITVNCQSPFIQGLIQTLMPAVPNEDGSYTITDDLSTAPHGFHWRFQVTAPCASIAICTDFDMGDWEFRVTPGLIDGDDGFLVDDILEVSDWGLEKAVKIDRDGAYIYAADKVVAGSLWPIIFPGDNTFVIQTGVGTGELIEVQYYPAYWGV